MIILLTAAVVLGSWSIDDTPDLMTDKPSVKAELQGDNAKLVLRCGADGRLLAYDPTAYLGGGATRSYAYRPLIYKIDSNPPVKVHWQYQSNYALAPGKKIAVQLLNSLAAGQRLLIRAERYDGSTFDSTFDLAGSREAVPRLLQACGL